jgi:hypothetical protein
MEVILILVGAFGLYLVLDAVVKFYEIRDKIRREDEYRHKMKAKEDETDAS